MGFCIVEREMLKAFKRKDKKLTNFMEINI